MDARFLLYVFDAVFLLAISAWLGAIVYLFAVVAPVLGHGPIVGSKTNAFRALLGQHYLLLTICATIALASMVCGRITHNEYRGPFTGVLAVVAIAGILAATYGYRSFGTIAGRASGSIPVEGENGADLTRRDVVINGVSLFLGASLLVSHVTRPAPSSAGIVELTPEQRLQRQKNLLDERTKKLDDYLRKQKGPDGRSS